MDQQYSFEIVFLGYSIWVVHGLGVSEMYRPMTNILTNFKYDTATVGFGLVTSLCLWLGNESLFVVPDDVTKQNSTVAVPSSKFVRMFYIVLSFRLGH